MDVKKEYGRVPEWPMGTDCKSAAFSFGGSNPPAPTKNSGIQWVPEFLFYLPCKRGHKGGFEQLRRCRRRQRKNSPVQQRRPLPAAETGRSCWGCGSRNAPAPTNKTATYQNTLRFCFTMLCFALLFLLRPPVRAAVLEYCFEQ